MTDNFSGNLPFLVHMLYAVCLMAKTDIAAKLLSLLLAVVSAFGLYAFCARFLSRRVGALALFAFFAAGMVIEIAVTTRKSRSAPLSACITCRQMLGEGVALNVGATISGDLFVLGLPSVIMYGSPSCVGTLDGGGGHEADIISSSPR
jgi:hypothetical protein